MNYKIHPGNVLHKIASKIVRNPDVPEKYGLRSWFRFIFLILFLLCLYFSASAQKITLNATHRPLKEVLQSLRKQSGYAFIFSDDLISSSKLVTLQVSNKEILEVLPLIFKSQNLTYEINGKVITVVPLKQTHSQQKSQPKSLRGRVTDSIGAPLKGVTVAVKKTGRAVVTDNNGMFVINQIETGSIVGFSMLGFASVQKAVPDSYELIVALNSQNSRLDETVVIAYGTTTKRFATGSVSSVKAAEIEKQPVMNPLSALAGRVPGLSVVQNSGIPGSPISVNVRGRTSINPNISNDPLFIIDGVPVANNNSTLGSIGGISPFNSINPTDIESVEVLKDADATSIYGSRGANGVILITTKQGKEGKTLLSANIYSGVNTKARSIKMMNTGEYISMRKEALVNDGVQADEFNAYDFLLWDTLRNTDWQKELMGKSSSTFDANLSLSGGSPNTQFIASAGYHKETTTFPGGLGSYRLSGNMNINHRSSDKKFYLNVVANYGGDRNNLSVSDLTSMAIVLSPNTTSLRSSDGKLVWEDQGVVFDNPLGYLEKSYNANTNNYRGNVLASYKITNELTIKNSLGINTIYFDENSTNPIASQNPAFGPVGYSSFGNSKYSSFIVEPQIEYARPLWRGNLTALIGGTWQKNDFNQSTIIASGYTSDALLKSLSAAGVIDSKTSNSSNYKYAAAFGRIIYNLDKKYLISLTGRRDGSSRFGPKYRYSNFGALGVGWIFSQESWLDFSKIILTFGKLRASYGTSGNDKIGDYNYLETWSVLPKTIMGNSGLYPTRLFNPDYRWEMNKKIEMGLDLGFLQDKVLFTANWYKNRSSNQLIPFTLPIQTGGSSVIRNFPAVVENKGLEFELSTTNIKKQKFSWTTGLNLSVPRNKLIEFPNLAESSYAKTLVVGKPLSIASTLSVTGVNTETGVYEFLKKDGTITSMPNDQDVIMGAVNIDPKFLGGLSNTITVGAFQLDLLFEFRKQTGKNVLSNVIEGWLFPGMPVNMPVEFLDRWTESNRHSTIQKYTANPGTSAYTAANAMRLYGADIFYTDASYIRLKNLSASYSLQKLLSSTKLKTLRIYCNAQNLLTITRYKGGDPEIRTIYRLPPLRTITLGLQASL